MSSMIDVTFLLLIYFIVTTVLTPAENQLTPALKVEQGVAEKDNDLEPQILGVKMLGSAPAYVIGEQVLRERTQLAALLARLPRDPGLIIRVENTVTVGFAIAAVQEARNAGFERVTYVPMAR